MGGSVSDPNGPGFNVQHGLGDGKAGAVAGVLYDGQPGDRRPGTARVERPLEASEPLRPKGRDRFEDCGVTRQQVVHRRNVRQHPREGLGSGTTRYEGLVQRTNPKQGPMPTQENRPRSRVRGRFCVRYARREPPRCSVAACIGSSRVVESSWPPCLRPRPHRLGATDAEPPTQSPAGFAAVGQREARLRT